VEIAERVAPEVAAALDPEKPFGLWTYGARETKRWREWDAEKGAFVTRHQREARPIDERLVGP
jgi:hypothetical protein